MYLNNALVLECFKRLKINNLDSKHGKVQMERTSSLMIMLSLDAATRFYGVQSLDVDFEKVRGKEMRKRLALEYSKLVLVSNSENGNPQSIHELGCVFIGGKSPEARISSNFLTTHVPKARECETAFDYPARPAPLLQLGKVATGMPYGIQLHPEWQIGMSQHLADVSSNTPFTDLAVFCLRYVNFGKKDSITDTLCAMLRGQYTKELADFWVSKVKQERMFAKHLKADAFMEDTLVDSLSRINNMQTRRAELLKYDKDQLVEMIIRAESQKA